MEGQVNIHTPLKIQKIKIKNLKSIYFNNLKPI